MACLPVVQHQAEAVALVSRTRLRAVGDVVAIRRIERSLIRRLVVGSGVLLCRKGSGGRGVRAYVNRDNEQVIVRAGGFDFIVVRGEANLLPIRREGVIVLPAKRKDWSIVIARSEIAGSHAWSRTLPVLRRGGCPHPPRRALADDSLPRIARPGGRRVRPHPACAPSTCR